MIYRWIIMDLTRVNNEEKLNLCRKYYLDVIRSMIGAAIWTAIIITWVVIFQQNRVSWGLTADKISFIIPRGIP
ncbi:hypothetical protein KUTeg_006234 [Tegillarca granosa]|uniref:Gamma-secretase subunit PEN-2 n=1 Tax=Tegillarca granosa TaxID=220873 RepID=A0ABQ9FG04_TEGGR|nr:hypothetical protein KUTeg_006234 [Tegillarca granosa]